MEKHKPSTIKPVGNVADTKKPTDRPKAVKAEAGKHGKPGSPPKR